MMMTVTGINRDEGTVILLTTRDDQGRQCLVGCDRRAALDIVAHLNLYKQGLVDDPPVIDPPDWSVMGGQALLDPRFEQ